MNKPFEYKGPPFTPHAADPFYEACRAYHEKNDIDPLIALLRSDRPLSSHDREQLTRLVDQLYALGQARRRGKPFGKHTLWDNPNYVADYLLQRRLAEYKRTNGRRYVSAALRDKMIDELIDDMKCWELSRRKGLPRKDRILDLQRVSKKLRL
jgi:hypothetical protein